MKRKINSYIRSLIGIFLIFSNVLFTSQSIHCIDIKNESLNIEDESVNAYVKFANYLDVDYEELQDKLVSVVEDKEYRLAPLNNVEKHRIFFKKIFSSCDENYMKFYARGKRLSEEEAENNFQGRLKRMWENKLPGHMTLIVELNKECVGLISLGPLKMYGFDPEIAYIVDQDHCGKGVGLKSVKLTIDFLQYLKDKGTYDFKCLKATVHPLNVGSYKILEKSGFECEEGIKIFSYGERKSYTYNFL